MENDKNRNYWLNTFTAEDIKDYKKNKKNYFRFLIRIDENEIEEFMAIHEGFNNIGHCKKNNASSAKRDAVEQYNFTCLPYDNSNAKDMRYSQIVMICRNDDKDEIKDILTNYYAEDITFNNNGNCLTVHIKDKINARGEWVNVDGVSNVSYYPVSVVSYRRANKYGRTHLFLTKCKIKHHLFIEPKDEADYKKWYNKEYCQLHVADENFSEQKLGSTPMRNYILDYWRNKKNMKNHFKEQCINQTKKVQNYCWVLDDNIKNYIRYWQGEKNTITSNVIFNTIEQHVQHYTNIGIASHNSNPPFF